MTAMFEGARGLPRAPGQTRSTPFSTSNSLLACGLLLALCTLTGCRSYFPAEVKQQAAASGAAGVSYGRIGAHTYLVTTQFIAGQAVPASAPRRTLECRGEAWRVQVRWKSERVEDAQADQLCRWISSAVGFVSGYSGTLAVNDFRVDIVEEGERRDARWLSVAPAGKLSMRLAVRWLEDEGHRAAEAMSLFAHELTHVEAYFLRPEANADTEELAHLVGACAQWQGAGVLSARDLIAGPLNVDEDVFRHSSQVAHRIWSLLHRFVAEGPLQAGTPLAHAFSTLCEQRLQRGFAALRRPPADAGSKAGAAP